VFVPASPLIPLKERLSEVTLPLRSYPWLRERRLPLVRLLGRLAASYPSVAA
jgi:hypothetical protein